MTVPGRIWTRDRPECDFPTCAVACVCSCSLENPQSKACGKNLGKTIVKLRFCAIFKQKHWKKRRIFILSWLWAQKNVCHSRTKCKFSIFLSILLGVFEAQVTVDRWRAVILRVGVAKRCKYCQKLTFCTKNAPSRRSAGMWFSYLCRGLCLQL